MLFDNQLVKREKQHDISNNHEYFCTLIHAGGDKSLGAMYTWMIVHSARFYLMQRLTRCNNHKPTFWVHSPTRKQGVSTKVRQ